jgi:hypothetical protein
MAFDQTSELALLMSSEKPNAWAPLRGILPWRVFRPFEGVVPVTSDGAVLDAQAAANRGFSGLHGWMAAAEAVWSANAESGTMTLVERWNYHNELGAQFPVSALRVVYAASGTVPAACLLRAIVRGYRAQTLLVARVGRKRSPESCRSLKQRDRPLSHGGAAITGPMGSARFRQGGVHVANPSI